jgi:hypothetical protein
MPRQTDNQSEPLLIDRAAAAELASADGVREWAREKHAFISSVKDGTGRGAVPRLAQALTNRFLHLPDTIVKKQQADAVLDLALSAESKSAVSCAIYTFDRPDVANEH